MAQLDPAIPTPLTCGIVPATTPVCLRTAEPGLEDVEKSLPAPSTAWTRRSGTQSMLRVPLVASTGRPGYWLELLVALVVAVAQRRLGPSSSARTSTVERALPLLMSGCGSAGTPRRCRTGARPAVRAEAGPGWGGTACRRPARRARRTGGTRPPARR